MRFLNAYNNKNNNNKKVNIRSVCKIVPNDFIEVVW